MFGRASRWRWALFGAIALLMIATGMVAASDPGTLRNVGIGIFALAALTYIAARIAILREDHFK